MSLDHHDTLVYRLAQMLVKRNQDDKVSKTDAYNTEQHLAYAIKGAKTQNPKPQSVPA